jgi:hypothetical protein
LELAALVCRIEAASSVRPNSAAQLLSYPQPLGKKDLRVLKASFASANNPGRKSETSRYGQIG